MAGGNYTQTFTGADGSTVPSWGTANDTFIVSNNRYTNTVTNVDRSIAYYSGGTWDTNYTYSVDLSSDWEASGNQVGAIFNHVDAANYYEVSISVHSASFAGQAILRKVVNGTPGNVVTPFTPGANDDWPERDVPFTVQIVRSGTTASVKVNGVTAFTNVSLGSLTAGHVGFSAKTNHGWFDNVSVTTSAATLLFRSGFELDTKLTDMFCVSGLGQQNLTGKDNAPNTTAWPPEFWKPASTRLFNTGAKCTHDSTPGNPDSLYDSQIRIALINSTDRANATLGLPEGIPGPTNTNTRYLYGNVKLWHDPAAGSSSPRAGITYQFRNESTPAPRSYYIRRYLHYPAGIVNSMGTYGWFIQNEYKTDCGTPVDGRLLVRVHKKDNLEQSFHQLFRDWNNDCGHDPDDREVLAECLITAGSQTCPPLPENGWFYDEFYARTPEGSDRGVVKYAINGKVIFDHTPPADATVRRQLPMGINRIKMTPGYLNIERQDILADDVEVYSEPPCAQFPCGAPTHVN